MFKSLRCKLLRQGMPLKEVRRLIRELRDHRADLIEHELADGESRESAETIANTRLGGIDQIADAAVNHFRQRTYAGRHPLLYFGFAPLFVLLIVWIGVCLAIVGVGSQMVSAAPAILRVAARGSISCRGFLHRFTIAMHLGAP